MQVELAARLSAPLEQLVEKRTRWRLFKTRGVSNVVSGSRPLHLLSPQCSPSTYSVLSLVRFSICSAILPLCFSSFLPSTFPDKSACGVRRCSSSSKGTLWARKRKTSFTPGSSARRRRLILSVCAYNAGAVRRCLRPASFLSSPFLSLCFSRLSTPSCAYIPCLPQR